MTDRNPEAYARHLAGNKRPHPMYRRAKREELTCLGHACGHRKFMSKGPTVNRLCPSCRHTSDMGLGGNTGIRIASKGKAQ